MTSSNGSLFIFAILFIASSAQSVLDIQLTGIGIDARAKGVNGTSLPVESAVAPPNALEASETHVVPSHPVVGLKTAVVHRPIPVLVQSQPSHYHMKQNPIVCNPETRVVIPPKSHLQLGHQMPAIDWKKLASPFLVPIMMPFAVGAKAAAVGAAVPAVAGAGGAVVGSLVSAPIIGAAVAAPPLAGLKVAGLFGLPVVGGKKILKKMRGKGIVTVP